MATVVAWRAASWFLNAEGPWPLGELQSASYQPRPYVGYRDCRDADAPPKRPGEFLIVMSGGSTVWGFGWPLPRVLARRFARAGYHRVRVVNCGVVAQNSSQELARLVFRMADLKPDLLLVYDGGNDVMNPVYLDPRPGYPHDFILFEHNPLLQEPGKMPLLMLGALDDGLWRRMLGRRLIRSLIPLDEERASAGYGTAAWRERLAQTYARNIVKIGIIARAFGIRPIIAFQPLLYDKKPLAPFEVERSVEVPQEVSFNGLDDWRAHAEDVKARIRRLRGERAFGPWPEFWDLSSILDGQPQSFGDHIHVTDRANEVIAGALFERLRPMVPAWAR